MAIANIPKKEHEMDSSKTRNPFILLGPLWAAGLY